MALRTRLALILAAGAIVGLSGPLTARQQAPERLRAIRPDFDIRDRRPPAEGSARARAELRRQSFPRRRGSRLHPHTGALRVLDTPGWSGARTALPIALRNRLVRDVDRLGLDEGDLEALTVARDYVTRSTGMRHVTFAQSFDGIPVFGGAVTVHIAATGEIVRVTSSAARGDGRRREPVVSAEAAAILAAGDIDPGTLFVPRRVGAATRLGTARFERGGFLSDVTASLVWFAMDGGLRLAWHVELEPDGLPQFYDLVVDAETGDILLRRNRVLDANGTGRILQSAATEALDPRRPDPMPSGVAACPPPVNHELRDLVTPFRDPSSVLSDSGRLSGNNVRVLRGNTSTEAASGTFDGSRWVFDFPFNSAGAAETALFFSLNFAHDFFYDLGFDEASGNFQVDNFGRGGLGGDPIAGVARAAGRNNATFQPAPEGSSPIIRMFLWDGSGCWSEDVDGDGVEDIDGDFDTDIVLHEFHHGVSHRLNTSFNGHEANAIGEGGGDFFAYSVNGDTSLAEYARPGGLRTVNGKTYNDWYCQSGYFCQPHGNGEIWANVLWHIRERFRADLVRGSDAAAINESHQLYIDGLKLSPPSPTMLDLRDAMLEADAIRNPGSPDSVNFCALWESFAARGMGVDATDTADNGLNQVGANFAVPPGCTPQPSPPLVTLAITAATATEAGPTSGTITISREAATEAALAVNFTVAGTATRGVDYAELPATATIPAGAVAVDVAVVPLDDATLEGNETVVVTLRSGPGYLLAPPTVGTVTIVSDDVAPDFTVTVLTGPALGGAGLTLDVTDTTRNQGTGPSGESTTSFYLSLTTALDATDPLVGTRPVPGLLPDTTDIATTTLMVPAGTAAGTYWIIAKADGPGAVGEPNETNNTRTLLVRVGPDLAVTALTAPPIAGPGASVIVNDTTKNQGGGHAAASSTRFYLSPNSTLDASDAALESRGVEPLTVGASTTTTTTVRIPTTVTSGTFYLIAVADDGNALSESTENNNTRFVTIRIGADLLVSALTAPTRVGSGSTISVTDTIRNSGGGGSGPSTTAFYLSANLTFDAGDARLSGTRSVGPLDAGASSLGTTAVTLPAVATGTWYLIAAADDTGDVAETQETNNIRLTTIYVGPDLLAAGVSAPFTATAGSMVTVTDSVRNIGADVAAASTTRFYLSLNYTLDADDILLDGERSVAAIAANGISTGPTSVMIPAGLSGRYTLLAVADALGAVAESSETNNVSLRSITINP